MFPKQSLTKHVFWLASEMVHLWLSVTKRQTTHDKRQTTNAKRQTTNDKYQET